MKCLVRVLGLYDVYHPKTNWKCAWCTVNASQLSDFSELNPKHCEFRSIEYMRRTAQGYADKSESTKKSEASTNQGIKVFPLLPNLTKLERSTSQT